MGGAADGYDGLRAVNVQISELHAYNCLVWSLEVELMKTETKLWFPLRERKLLLSILVLQVELMKHRILRGCRDMRLTAWELEEEFMEYWDR